MSALVSVLAIIAAVALVLFRQFRTQQFTAGGRWWLVPAVIAVLAVREHAVIDPSHRAGSIALLVVELTTGALVGAGWAWTTRMWSEPDGTVWSRGTKATAFVWLGGVVLRGAVIGLGALLGVAMSTGGLMLSLAAGLLVRAGVLTWRGGRTRAAYGEGTAASLAGTPLRKETV